VNVDQWLARIRIVASREVVRRFAWIFVPLAMATACVVAAMYWNQSRVDRKLLEAEQRSHVDLCSEIIEDDFRSIVSDLMFLAEGQTLSSLLDNPQSMTARNAVSDEFRLFVKQKGIYDQVRFLDETGKEVVRVNLRRGEAVVVSEDRLQDKRDRYYFQATIPLQRGQVFVSPFDLNIEEDQIERPLKPTIRFATPVLDSGGTKRGIVVLNYLGAVLLDKLRRAVATSAGRMMLLNTDGYWLVGERPDDEWAFMVPERQHVNFAARFPDVWRRVASERTGVVATRQGIFVFRTVYPMYPIRESAVAAPAADDGGMGKSSQEEYAWKVISYANPATVRANTARLLGALGRMAAGGVAALAVVSWLLARTAAAHQHARAQLLQSERLAAIGEAMAALAHESRNALQRSQAGLEMLVKRLKDRPESLELLGEVQKAQCDLHELYEKVRSYAAPLQLRCRNTHLGQLASETWAHLSVQRSGRAVQLTQSSTAANLQCSVDPTAIGQVFRNVFENALAATNQQAEIHVAFADDHLHGAPALRISIRDNGPGLTAEQRLRIFEPFYTTKLHGTGLGMAIAKRIVEAHGGTISVGSSAGPGAEVMIRLIRK
jgi:signal transduction histidine kinase